jgi:ribosomal protein S18 acetylase RimI-like enzyme
MEAVRAATVGDLDRLGELGHEFVQGLVTQRGGSLLVGTVGGLPDPTGLARRFADLVDAADQLVLVGTVDRAVCGFALARLGAGGAEGSIGVLEGCYVEPAARGVGVGRLLLDTVVAWLGERGCSGVDGTALPGDRAAKNFFEAAGFKARVLTMHRNLG